MEFQFIFDLLIILLALFIGYAYKGIMDILDIQDEQIKLIQDVLDIQDEQIKELSEMLDLIVEELKKKEKK